MKENSARAVSRTLRILFCEPFHVGRCDDLALQVAAKLTVMPMTTQSQTAFELKLVNTKPQCIVCSMLHVCNHYKTTDRRLIFCLVDVRWL